MIHHQNNNSKNNLNDSNNYSKNNTNNSNNEIKDSNNFINNSTNNNSNNLGSCLNYSHFGGYFLRDPEQREDPNLGASHIILSIMNT